MCVLLLLFLQFFDDKISLCVQNFHHLQFLQLTRLQSHHLLCFRLSLHQRRRRSEELLCLPQTLLVIWTVFQQVSSNLVWMYSSNLSPLSSTCHCLRDLSKLPSSITFNSSLSLTKHISSICKSAYYQIRQLRQIRSSLDVSSVIILANSLVISKLDYCNSLLNRLPKSSINCLQVVENSPCSCNWS